MNTTAEREALKADLFAGRSSNEDVLTGNKKGKAFAEALDKCKTAEDVINLLCKTMPLATIKDRASHVTENPLVLNFRKAALDLNIRGGYEPRHGEMVMLAIEKGSHLTKGGIEGFKDVLKKSIAAREQAQLQMMAQTKMAMA